MQINQHLDRLPFLQVVSKCLGLISIQFDHEISVSVCLLHYSVLLGCAILSATSAFLGTKPKFCVQFHCNSADWDFPHIYPDSMCDLIAFSWLRYPLIYYVWNSTSVVTKQFCFSSSCSSFFTLLSFFLSFFLCTASSDSWRSSPFSLGRPLPSQ